MADVGGRRDAAQLVLVTAIVLAATLVGLSLVLNTVIFTENLATRQTSEQIDQSTNYHEATNESVSETLGTVNNNPANDSHSKLRKNLSNAVENETEIFQRDAVTTGDSVNVSVRESTDGFLLKQTNASRNFTAGGSQTGSQNWTLATDASPRTEIRMNVTREPMFAATADTSMSTLRQKAYSVQIHNDSLTWRVYIVQGAITGNIYFVNDRSDLDLKGKVSEFTNRSCWRNSEFARADFHAGTVEGTDCQALSFYQNLSDDINITYNNTFISPPVGSDDVQVRGTYRARVNESAVNGEPFHAAADDRSPFMVTALTTSHVELTHETDGLSYQSRFGVRAPSLGKFQTPERDPTITSFSVTDKTDGTDEYDFEVSVDVNDPDANLDRVEFVITDDEGAEVDNASVAVSGGVDSATHRFESGTLDVGLFEDDGNFTLQATAYDATNRTSASPGETHKADGDDTTGTDEKWPSYGETAPSAPEGASGATDADLARATPTPPAEAPSVDEPTTDAVPTPDATTNVTTTTNATDVEGDL